MRIKQTKLYRANVAVLAHVIDKRRFARELRRAWKAGRAQFFGSTSKLNYAFAWLHTPQGVGYWDEMHMASGRGCR
jgi:hypothetical protein